MSEWWRDAVIYQIYIRSFADGDGDGLGDIAGIRSRLGYLRDLGVDALWINPWYVSPQADAGYDVADYRAIDPRFGTLADAEELISEAHGHGLRLIPDLVPNHTSSAHPWFRAALADEPGARERYVFRPGRGDGGDEPPNDWRGNFGGSAWTRVEDGSWYLHLFDPEQPDLNWANPEVRAEFEDILRFWFDRGVDGFRIDVANALVKDPALPDLAGVTHPAGGHPYYDRDAVVEIYESWRRIAEEYDGERMFVAEAWVGDAARLARYVSHGRLQTAFNFDYLLAPWDPARLREEIDTTTESLRAVGAPATWVLSNHDVVRHPSRYGRAGGDWEPGHALPAGVGVDRELGTRRARAALLLEAALPGGMYVYQGEELGLFEVEDLPEDVLADPTWERSGHTERGRDGARVPIPWTADGPSFGFGPDDGAAPWLPQPAWFAAYAADHQGSPGDGSMLALYRAALTLRRERDELGEGGLAWLSAPGDEVLHFRRGEGVDVVVNLSAHPVELPAHREVLLASAPGAALAPDAAVWLAV